LKVLLTGGTGYLGSILLPHLVDAGHEVRVLVHKTPLPQSLGPRLLKLDVVEGDITDRSILGSLVSDVDAVIHLAAVVGDQACLKNHNRASSINYTASRALFEQASEKRIIFASTCSIYGASKRMAVETQEPNTPDYYSITKLAAETALSETCSNYVIFRFGTLYGLSHRMRFDLVVNKFIAQSIQEGKITVYGGNQFRPFLDVNMAAKGIVEALERGKTINPVRGLYNLGGVNYRMLTVASLIADTFEDFEEAIRNIRGKPNGHVEVQVEKELVDKRDYLVSSEKAIRELDISFDDMITIKREAMMILSEYSVGAIKDYREPQYHNDQRTY